MNVIIRSNESYVYDLETGKIHSTGKEIRQVPFAIGMALTAPHGSRRAELPHRAPASGNGVSCRICADATLRIQ